MTKELGRITKVYTVKTEFKGEEYEFFVSEESRGEDWESNLLLEPFEPSDWSDEVEEELQEFVEENWEKFKDIT